MNALKILAWLMLGSVWAAACGGVTASSGSNSNWLDACSKTADCAGGLTCASGVCRTKSDAEAPPRSGIPDGGGQPTCESRLSEATRAFQAALNTADRSCATSADCDRVALGYCGGVGCAAYPVSNAGAAQVLSANNSIDAAICAAGRIAGCFPDSGVFLSCPSTAALAPVCIAGKCMDQPALDSGTAL